MDWIKTQLTKWWVWVILTVVFLAVVQYAFYKSAPYPWLDAVWEAGDFISLVGTLVLGYIAMLQTRRANDMAKDANETSRTLIQLQKAEYTPVVTVTKFVGVTKHVLNPCSQSTSSEVILHEMRCSDGEVLVGYSISLFEENFDITKDSFCRDYEIHLKYSGRFVMESFQIKEIRFYGNGFEEKYLIANSLEMSLSNDDEFRLFVFLISNEDFVLDNTAAHQHIKASHIVFEVEMRSLTGEIYTETIKVRKHLVKEPEPTFHTPNVEMLVSASYHVQEERTGK